MSRINVSSEVIRQYRQVVEEARESINFLLFRMKTKVRNAGNTWNDENYRKLEMILNECLMDLRKIYEIIVEAEEYLEDTYVTVLEYEKSDWGYTKADSKPISVDATLKQTQVRTFRDRMVGIERILFKYKQELLVRNVTDEDKIRIVLNHYRHQLQADLLRNMNGECLIPRPTPDFDVVAANIQRNSLNHCIGIKTPRNLTKTRYGFRNIVFNGKEMNVYDDPIGTARLLIKKQGNSCYPMEGTCGLCQSANILTMAGIPTKEEDMISIALHASDDVLTSMELFERDSSNRGGTTCHGRKEILESQGIPIVNVPVNVERNQTVRWLADMVASGRGVILSVDVEYLWRNGQSGGHAISLLSVTSDGSEFIYSDTGRGSIDTISAEDLARALTGRPVNVTRNIIR